MVRDHNDGTFLDNFRTIVRPVSKWVLDTQKDDRCNSSNDHCAVLDEYHTRPEDDAHGHEQASIVEEKRVKEVFAIFGIEAIVSLIKLFVERLLGKH